MAEKESQTETIKEEKATLPEPPEPVVTHHKLGNLEYEAHAGKLPIKNQLGEIEATLFFTAYFMKNPPERRPLVFCFNGGPGSSSVWLHMGVIGPKRVKMQPDGDMPAPPFEMEDNMKSWLFDADLVFIDPVGTGYSRAVKPELNEKFWGLEGDIKSVGEFIRLFLSRYKRWASPLYLAGESYGTTRAAGLSGHLIEHGIAFNGIILISTVLTFQTLDFTPGNDLPYSLFLPTYAATAAYHKKVSPRKPLRAFLKEVEAWAEGPYTLALQAGDKLKGKKRQQIKEQLAKYTGLSNEFLEACNLRVNIHEFCKELLRTKGETVGRLDSRFKGVDNGSTGQYPAFDPSMTAIRPPYTALINDWFTRGLNYYEDTQYRILGEGGDGELWKKWNWGSAREGHPDTSRSMRDALAKNPSMKVFVASGFYDLATPYFATEYTLNHMNLGPYSDNVKVYEYAAGHMMYIDETQLAKLNEDIKGFIV